MPAGPHNAEYLRKRRAAAVERGICGQCVKRQAVTGLRHCAECLAAHEQRERAKKLGPNAWCVSCQRGDGQHRAGCAAPRRAA